ncbi:c-type cytochrome [Mangrovimonas aestuarii]|uniref:c-type cytochrome n=1 Tax=Mangrovimonas aestuarii TaxID=3018443 RepID=UPI002379A44D|nr:c-type cytochrome [Mangrovimonas aestuarii]
MENKEFISQLNLLKRKIGFCCLPVLAIGVVALLFHFEVFKIKKDKTLSALELKYDISTLGNTEDAEEIRLGYDIFVNTADYIGPDNGNQKKIFSGNNLACGNCHLSAGTKPYSGPLVGVVNRFPQYRAREDKEGTITERIDGCMERSMNGKAMPIDIPEMQALLKYINWLNKDTPTNGIIEGQGYISLEIPNRPVDLNRGRLLFQNICSVCHGTDGQGVKQYLSNGYEYPPLWGPNSFNNGAGMNRVITAAQFIKANMPYGTSYNKPYLTDEEAYDVAGFINQQQRPTKPNLENDFPDLKKKPVSTPYPPYLDSFPHSQHQLGPYKPIMDYYKKNYNIEKTK